MERQIWKVNPIHKEDHGGDGLVYGGPQEYFTPITDKGNVI